MNQIINTNCLDFIPTLPDEYLDSAISDPPYGAGFDYDGDSSIHEAQDLLTSYLKALEPKLKRSAHVVLFWTMRNLDVLIDTIRSCGLMYRRTLSMYIPKGNARPYLGWLPRTQAILVCQKYLPRQPSEFHNEMSQYLFEALTKSEHTRTSLAKELNCDSRLVMKWTRQGDPSYCLPTPRFYVPLKKLLNLDDRYDILLTREPQVNNHRKDMIYQHDCYIVDDNNAEMLHPSQKPLRVVEHLVQCTTEKGGLVFDGFAGSGTTALAAKNTGRNYLCCEIDSDFHKIAVSRLSVSDVNDVINS